MNPSDFSDHLNTILNRIETGENDESDLKILRELLDSFENDALQQLSKYNVSIKDGKGVHIGDRIYQQWDEKAIKALVKTIQNSGIHQNTQGGDSATRDIDKSTTTIFQFFFSDNEFKPPSQLSSIDIGFTGISEDIIQQAYEDSLPPYAADWNLPGNSISQKIYALEQFGKLPNFFDKLIQDENLSLVVRDQLQAISKQLALKKLPEIPNNRSSPSSGEARLEQLRSYLIATLVPDDTDRDQFLLNAWLIVDDSVQNLSKFQSLLDPDEQQQGKLCKLAQIPIELNKFLKKARKHLRGKKFDLTIEIFLPSNLMCMEIDRWKITDPIADEITLGIKYPVRLRSLERLDLDYLDFYLSDWYKCWDKVRMVLQNESIQDIFEHLEEIESFNWKLLKNKLNDKIGLKITCTHPKSMRKDLFKAILQATTPVVIWIRNDIPDPDRVTAINEILTFRPLAHLCESVRKTRELADAQEAEHIGLHLAVLWENPYRLTPDVMVELKPVGY
jgi:vWA-MoxR associated protein C-terminal domain/Effector-associated domain 10